MRRALIVIFFFAFTHGAALGEDTAPQDSKRLQELYAADQEARSPENRAAGLAPSLQEERDRRFEVFRLISEGELESANDFFRAGMILHHTSSIHFDDGHFASLGTESKLLAFFLFRRSHILGHPSGLNMMAAAYNYYLQACGEDAGKYGYDFLDRKPVWRPGVTDVESEELKCGFDPRPYLNDSPPTVIEGDV